MYRAQNYTTLANCLRKLGREEFLAKIPRNMSNDYDDFVPIIFDGDDGLLPDPPEALAEKIKFNGRALPMMIGTTADESALDLLILNKKNINASDISREIAEKMIDNLTATYSNFHNRKLVAEVGGNTLYSNTDYSGM